MIYPQEGKMDIKIIIKIDDSGMTTAVEGKLVNQDLAHAVMALECLKKNLIDQFEIGASQISAESREN